MDAEPKKRKIGRPPMTEEQKAEKARRKKEMSKKERDELGIYFKTHPVKGGGRTGNWYNLTDEEKEERHNSRYLKQALVSMDLPPIDISDPKQIEARIGEYFEYCGSEDKKPSPVGMANWIGVTPRTIYQWRHGKVRSTETERVINRALALMEEFITDQIQETKTNPANFIFLTKNWFGYRDQTDVMVGAAADTREVTKDELEKWLLDDGKRVETTFTDGNK